MRSLDGAVFGRCILPSKISPYSFSYSPAGAQAGNAQALFAPAQAAPRPQPRGAPGGSLGNPVSPADGCQMWARRSFACALPLHMPQLVKPPFLSAGLATDRAAGVSPLQLPP